MSKYWELQESYQWCNEIGDFFENPLVKRAYGELWNEVNSEESTQISPRDFNIFNSRHLSFIREVFESKELSERFLVILKNKSIWLKNINQLKYDTRQMLSFILIWQDISWRIQAYSETLVAIFQERIYQTVDEAGATIAYTNWDHECSNFVGFNSLISKWFSPIDENWNLIYGVEDGSMYWFFYVINEDREEYFVNPNWKILSKDEVDFMVIEWQELQISLYQDCINFLKSEKKYKEASDDVKQTLLLIEVTADVSQNEQKQEAIIELENKINDLREKIKARKRLEVKGKLVVHTNI